MNKDLTLQECADAVTDIMRSLHYRESTIKIYQKIFDDFLIYSHNAGTDNFDEIVYDIDAIFIVSHPSKHFEQVKKL